jgi:DNA polymerase
MPVSARQRAYLQAMDIDTWVERERGTKTAAEFAEPEAVEPAPAAPPAAEAPASAASPGLADASLEVGDLGWDELVGRVAQCTLCPLHEGRTQTVFGVGNRQAQILFVGEAPGAEEDRQGEPFVGRAGKLLNEMLRAIDLKREDVYIANILKCRPPNNRDPQPEEASCCAGYLNRQIALIQPRVIVALGRIAAQRLLQTDTSLGRLRGRVHQYADTGTPLLVSYHPAFLLRSPREKRKAWQDLQFLRRTVAELA